MNFVEGFNGKVKVLKRRCYWITNLEHLFQRIFVIMKAAASLNYGSQDMWRTTRVPKESVEDVANRHDPLTA